MNQLPPSPANEASKKMILRPLPLRRGGDYGVGEIAPFTPTMTDAYDRIPSRHPRHHQQNRPHRSRRPSVWREHRPHAETGKSRQNHLRTYHYGPVPVRVWPSRDPIGERGGINLYGMVGNDLIGNIDVLGEQGFDFPTRPIVFQDDVRDDKLGFQVGISHEFSRKDTKPFKAQIVLWGISWTCRGDEKDQKIDEEPRSSYLAILDSHWGGEDMIPDVIEAKRGTFGDCDICSAEATVTGLMKTVKLNDAHNFLVKDGRRRGQPANNFPIPGKEEFYLNLTDKHLYTWVIKYEYEEDENGKVKKDNVQFFTTAQ